jgi:hypothetical protein
MILLLYKSNIAKKQKGGDELHLNKEVFLEFIQTNFEGNLNKCARELDVSPSTIWRVTNGCSKAGVKLLTNLMQYCNKSKLNYHDIIFLD